MTCFLEFCVFNTSIESFEEGAFMCQSPRDLLYTIKPTMPILAGCTNMEGYFAFVGKYSSAKFYKHS